VYVRKLLLHSAALALCAVSWAAQAGPVSGCATDDPISPFTQTCNLYETDANGDPSEVSSPITNQFKDGSWAVGDWLLVKGPGPSNGTPSDVVRFFLDPTSANGGSNTAILYSDGSTEFGQILAEHTNAGGLFGFLGTLAENLPGPVVILPNDFGDTVNVFSTPEPATLLLMALGFAGLAARRRSIA
jgi:hypothetical protein